MYNELQTVKMGLAIVLLGLFFGVGMGISFGINEDAYKEYVAEGVAANPEVHDVESEDKIWRYAQRAHFHSNGIAAFSIGLIVLLMFCNMRPQIKTLSSIFIGLGSFYPLSWFSMFFFAPSIGRDSAHDHLLTEMFTYIGVGGILLGSVALVANLYFGAFSDENA